LVSVDRAAAELGIDRTAILALLRDGRVAMWRIGRSIHVDVDQVAVASSLAPDCSQRRTDRDSESRYGWKVTPAMRTAVRAAAARAGQRDGDWVVTQLERLAAPEPGPPTARRQRAPRGTHRAYTAEITLALTIEQRTRFRAAAAAEGLSLTEWIRQSLPAQLLTGHTDPPAAPSNVPTGNRRRADAKRALVTTHVTRPQFERITAAAGAATLAAWGREVLADALQGPGDELPPDGVRGEVTITIPCTIADRHVIEQRASQHDITKASLVRRYLIAATTG
jgi:hypothetical protein